MVATVSRLWVEVAASGVVSAAQAATETTVEAGEAGPAILAVTIAGVWAAATVAVDVDVLRAVDSVAVDGGVLGAVWSVAVDGGALGTVEPVAEDVIVTAAEQRLRGDQKTKLGSDAADRG
jgi:hypothetical protein